MPRLTDLSQVRGLLDRDRDWAAYAIGDLAPGFIEHCEWRSATADPDVLMLIYRGFSPPIVFAMGSAAGLRPLFEEIDAPEISLHLRPTALAAMSGVYTANSIRHMRRMTLADGQFRPSADLNVPNVSRVGEEHSNAVAALYDDGHRRGEGPTFFNPSMLRQGTFHGIWNAGELIAIAGTHLYSAELSVCAIGNVYTRSDCRGRGLAAAVTSAVIRRALADRVRTIVLNVGEHNLTARRVYERLGFASYGDFVEGEATRDVR